MLSQQDFYKKMINDFDCKQARNILKQNNLDFTVYSCNDNIINQIISLSLDKKETELKDLFDVIDTANRRETDIDILLREKLFKNTKATNPLELFFNAFEKNETPERLFAVIGEPGVGKTYVIEKRFPGIPEYACNSALDPYSLCYYLADKDGLGLKPYETPFLKSLKAGGKVYLDEFNELPRDTKMFIQGITDEKEYVVIGDENIKISDGFKIIASFNPPSETDERDPLGDAILSRAVMFVMELTDDIIIDRLNVNQSWLELVRKLYRHVKNSGMIDVRDLDFRDYKKFAYGYDFESIFKAKICVGDISNIREYKKIAETGEYQQLLGEIKMEMKRWTIF